MKYIITSTDIDGFDSYVHRERGTGKLWLDEPVVMVYRNESVARKVRQKANRRGMGDCMERPFNETDYPNWVEEIVND